MSNDITFYANPMAIEIGSIGYNHTHEKNFFSDLPNGPGTYLFLLVKSPSIFTIKNKRYNVIKNSYVILTPTTPCTYKSTKEAYIDDWFYFSMTQSDIDFLLQNGVKLEQAVHLNDIDSLSALIHRIAYELFSAEPFHKEVQQHYTDIFFYELFRTIRSTKMPSPDFLSTKNEKLTYLRTRLFQEPSQFKSIDDMADFMNLSRSGFQHLYSKVFGKNVMQDVISGRIEKAKNLLKTTNLTISEIAGKCSYKTEYHFMRQFKEQTGLTPTEYRQSDTWNQIDTFKS